MADYDFRPGGSLKLKGVAEGGIVKKKKKSKSKPSKSERETELDRVRELMFDEDKKSASSSGSGRNSPSTSGGSGSRKTDAERRFEEVQKRRLQAKVAKLAHKTHKDRVSEFNNHLETLSEHHDIPKVGPG